MTTFLPGRGTAFQPARKNPPGARIGAGRHLLLNQAQWCRSYPAGYGPPAPAIVATHCRFARPGYLRCDRTGRETATDGLSPRRGIIAYCMQILGGFPWAREEGGDAGPDDPAQFVGGDGSFVVRVVREAGADAAQHLVQTLLRGIAVEADHEGVAEAALVRRVRGPQGRPRRRRGAVRRARGRLGGQRLGEVGVRQVVAGLVGRGEQGFEVRVRPVGREPPGPAAVPAAGEQGGFGGVGRGGVEPVEVVAGAGVGCAGQRGLLERDLMGGMNTDVRIGVVVVPGDSEEGDVPQRYRSLTGTVRRMRDFHSEGRVSTRVMDVTVGPSDWFLTMREVLG